MGLGVIKVCNSRYDHVGGGRFLFKVFTFEIGVIYNTFVFKMC